MEVGSSKIGETTYSFAVVQKQKDAAKPNFNIIIKDCSYDITKIVSEKLLSLSLQLINDQLDETQIRNELISVLNGNPNITVVRFFGRLPIAEDTPTQEYIKMNKNIDNNYLEMIKDLTGLTEDLEERCNIFPPYLEKWKNKRGEYDNSDKQSAKTMRDDLIKANNMLEKFDAELRQNESIYNLKYASKETQDSYNESLKTYKDFRKKCLDLIETLNTLNIPELEEVDNNYLKIIKNLEDTRQMLENEYDNLEFGGDIEKMKFDLNDLKTLKNRVFMRKHYEELNFVTRESPLNTPNQAIQDSYNRCLMGYDALLAKCQDKEEELLQKISESELLKTKEDIDLLYNSFFDLRKKSTFDQSNMESVQHMKTHLDELIENIQDSITKINDTDEKTYDILNAYRDLRERCKDLRYLLLPGLSEKIEQDLLLKKTTEDVNLLYKSFFDLRLKKNFDQSDMESAKNMKAHLNDLIETIQGKINRINKNDKKTYDLLNAYRDLRERCRDLRKRPLPTLLERMKQDLK